MKLIIGLGNIGPGYARSRHNLGFMVAERLAANLETHWKSEPKLQAEIATTTLSEGEKVVLAKPQTMMNLSGVAVQRLMQRYKVAPADVWVLFDDVDVPFGRLRLRVGGSAGGHQGAASIIRSVGDGFIRARLGISLNDRRVEPSESYVLKPFTPEEQEQLPALIDRAAAVILEQIQAAAPSDATFTLL
jgi:peptidyl-tRNA hydrolase, PTH1 family